MSLCVSKNEGTYVKSAHAGDVHGLPVNTKVKETPQADHVWLLYINQDSDGRFITRRYYQKGSINIEDLANHAQNSENKGDDSNWPKSTIGDLQFHESGTFYIILGKKNWRFYDYGPAGHQPIAFKREKTFSSRDSSGNISNSVENGDFNWSFVNGSTAISGAGLPIFKCDNLCKSGFDTYLKAGETSSLLFDINVEMPLAEGGDYLLIVIDPGGNNHGPPG